MTKMHLEPATMINVFDITYYGDGVKLSLADSPDGSERNAEHRATVFLTHATARKLLHHLQLFYAPAQAAPNVAEDQRTNFRQTIDAEPEPSA